MKELDQEHKETPEEKSKKEYQNLLNRLLCLLLANSVNISPAELQHYLVKLSYEGRAVQFQPKSLNERLKKCCCEVKNTVNSR